MRAEDRILFACARQELLPEHTERIAELCRQGPVDWERLAGIALRQGVAPIVGWNLKRAGERGDLGIPPELSLRLELALFENAAEKERTAARLVGALAHLAAAGLEALLLKGAALDLLVYDQPAWVVSRDLDLAVRRRSGEPLPRGDWEVRRPLYALGIECDAYTHHDVTMNGLLPVRFERIWADARPVDVRGAPALVMAPEDLLLSLAINACRKRFLRLKELFALAETLKRLPMDWARLGVRAREDRTEGIVYTALLATRETLGCPLPPEALDALEVSSARRQAVGLLLRTLLKQGTLAGFEGGDSAHPGRRLNPSLLLPYASLRGRQLFASLRLATRYHRPEGGAPAATPA